MLHAAPERAHAAISNAAVLFAQGPPEELAFKFVVLLLFMKLFAIDAARPFSFAADRFLKTACLLPAANLRVATSRGGWGPFICHKKTNLEIGNTPHNIY